MIEPSSYYQGQITRRTHLTLLDNFVLGRTRSYNHWYWGLYCILIKSG
ncbi:hypothetical protein FDUTEX481_06442 [Tolypothrix sp. PCC 7601]|nr:hypothetical protein FDUTEX481_06442 [Tolypothrix sp. PCC 7601]